jgi:hypothetical protein
MSLPWGWAKIALHEVPLKSARCNYPLLVNRKPFGVMVVTPSFLYESISAETFFAMRATCLRSPIDLQAVNGCRRPGDKTHSVIFDAVACARATRPIFSR